MSGDRIDLLAEIHRLEEENKELKRVNKLKHELYQEQKERADMLDKGLNKAMRFIDDFTRYACPYEIDSEDYMIFWPKCSKCGPLVGQEHDCWKRMVEMYISEFWCGVGSTLLCELGMIITFAVYNNRKK